MEFNLNIIHRKNSSRLHPMKECSQISDESDFHTSLPLQLRCMETKSKEFVDRFHMVNSQQSSEFQLPLQLPKFGTSQSKKSKYTKSSKNMNSRDVLNQSRRCFGTEVNIEIVNVNREIDSDGNLITGTYRNGHLHGMVQLEFVDGTLFEGIFQSGKRVCGKIQYSKGMKYVGQFNGPIFQGNGVFTFSDGKFIVGKWLEGNLKGNVEIHYPSGQTYFGPVDQGFRKHGYGSLVLQNGNEYLGYFRHGQIMGYGVYKKNDDKQIGGYWVKGELKTKQQYEKILNENKSSETQNPHEALGTDKAEEVDLKVFFKSVFTEKNT